MKKLQMLVLGFASFILLGASASAHVTVRPGDALTGERQTYTVGVPTEKDIPTVSVKVLIPEGLKSVSPFVKTGWEISVEKEGEGESAVVKSITWTNGSVPAGFRDEFNFRAVNPDKETELQWKAYQTYSDGTVVSWDQPPSKEGEAEGGNTGPFSVTKVKAKAADTAATAATAPAAKEDKTGTYLGAAALIVSFVALALATRKTAKK